ncbi:Uncharacterised protein [Corynebacterium kutscheri]|uniref:Uncharacterized protein n=1 Tax=Corynebacterium kutscheri TaxID=35755 RepID=A0A0F6TE76_9CORY|nr:hypothetical protein [Corynebacterium kutscheri]AKE41776.1 hypothetical protein UL82_08075 [Corynebacterium kutscheri]VEH09051.1 Uncharacterised protein [Corynebacterium kutscheri]VEH10102.1 Uncharacterised protein [Corynebacterium kutscheri]VEH80184.1 Uncharacterised protein [Corynebacterium kutscheri]
MDSVNSVLILAQQGAGPAGSEFGKASPVGWLVIVALLITVLFIGWAFSRRYNRLNRRRLFAEAHGLDLFDEEAVDKAMAEAGVLDQRKKSWF